MIHLENVTKRYGEVTAVSNLTLHIEKGELFGFIGPNGAGKTTTTKLIVGLLRPTSGNILVDGTDVQQAPEKAKSKIGYIPDSPYIYQSLTGREFLRFIGDLYGMKDSEIESKTGELFEYMEIGRWADSRVEEYSHGMRQKIVICSALIHDPAVILVDEPMVGLDPKSARKVKETFKNRVQNGTAVFVSTHSLSVAEEICTRVGVIDKGRLVAIGTMDDFRKASKSGAKSLEDIYMEITEGG
ncbi:ABC transporter ATP-binding protein [candidate division TA06 bacterium]|uniref:ABC transporter ATP-binding protein n=1 Tax=candidate division TA06 bacterium TaxID=2250710 RepID=A0A523UXE7_UNCT6|nr:MAG: ABC transporter ATP-binding protein [candidate division TA06 bacterium]